MNRRAEQPTHKISCTDAGGVVAGSMGKNTATIVEKEKSDMGRINAKQAIPFCLKKYWRPKAYGIEAADDKYTSYVAVVVFATESGQEKRLVDNRVWGDENDAANYAQALLQYAKGNVSDPKNTVGN